MAKRKPPVIPEDPGMREAIERRKQRYYPPDPDPTIGKPLADGGDEVDSANPRRHRAESCQSSLDDSGASATTEM